MRTVRTAARLLAILLAVLAALSYVLFLRPAALKARVLELLARYLAAEITLGSASLGPFGGLVLEGVDVRKQPGGALLFSAKRLRVRPRWSSFLRLRFRVKELDLREPDLRFERDAEGRLNWRGVVSRTPALETDRPPVFTFTRGTVSIGGRRIQGLGCELTPFPSHRRVALRGTVEDPFWGAYVFSGNADLDAETVRVAFDSSDLRLTGERLRAFPLVGKKVWRRYRPAGRFDLSGNVTLSWNTAREGDYSLVFTAKDASCRFLQLPVTNATGRVFVDPRAVIVNGLDGRLLDGRVEGYSIVNLDPPCTFFNRYTFQDVDIGALLRTVQPAAEGISGRGSGHVAFQGDHCLDRVQGRGELTVSDARFWRLPVLLLVLSKIRLAWPTGGEPAQECRLAWGFSEQGVRIESLSISSDILDLYGTGTMKPGGELDLTLYARPVGKSPLLFADLLLQPAFDSLSENLAQFRVTGTPSEPTLTVIPLTPVSRNLINVFDAFTLKRASP
jgi:hypothetical protein